MAFSTRIAVRFGDEDHAGIVYYPRFFHFFHVAFEDFFDRQGVPYARVLDDLRIGFPVVSVETDFKHTLRFGDRFDVDVWVERIGRSSTVFRYRGKKNGRDEVVAAARMTVVCVSRESWRAIPLPDDLRALFERNRAAPAA